MSVMVSELYTALRAAGVEETQARAAAESVLSEVATKADLQVLQLSIKADLSDLKAELIKWNVGTLLALSAIFGALKVLG
jgi:hypothetical protein